MVISKLGSPESKENHSLTSRRRFKNLKIHGPHYILGVKTCASCFHVSLSLPDLNKKHRNDIEMDEK